MRHTLLAPVLLALGGAALLAAAAPAAAQLGASATVTIGELGGPHAVSAGSSTQVPFTVSVESTGFVCGSSGEYEVTLSAEGGPEGVEVSVDPSNLTFPVAAGSYVGTRFTASGDSALLLNATPAAPNGTGNVTVTATLSQGPSTCQPRTQAKTAENSTDVEVAGGGGNETGGGNFTGNFTGGNGTFGGNLTGNLTGGNRTGDNVTEGGDEGIPGFEAGAVMLAAVAAAAVLVARNRRRAP